jgi:polar amino acid transport system substrate-binding protein
VIPVLRKLIALSALALCLGLVQAGPGLAQTDAKPLINGIDANFPPFAYVDPSGKAVGFDVEAVDWIAQKQGFKVAHQPMEWDSIVTSLKDRKIDFIASGLSVTPQRAEQIAFTKPYWVIKQVVLVKKDSALTLQEVLSGGHDIGVQRGTSDAEAMANSNNTEGRKYNLVLYDSGELAAADVVNGRLAAAVMNDAPAATAASAIEVKIIGEAGIPGEEFAYGVSKENPELLASLNEGLDLLMADPFWEALKEKYKPGEVH